MEQGNVLRITFSFEVGKKIGVGGPPPTGSGIRRPRVQTALNPYEIDQGCPKVD